jgi:hypothetical protein
MDRRTKLDKGIRNWEKIQKSGRLKYALKNALIFGLIFLLFIPLLNMLLHLVTDKCPTYSIKYYLFQSIFMFFAMGIFYYYFNWKSTEKQYKKWIKERDDKVNES